MLDKMISYFVPDPHNDGAIQTLAPVGFTGLIVNWPLPVPPPGFLLCDGSLQLISDYPELAELLGDTFGVATATEFYLPKLSRGGAWADTISVSAQGEVQTFDIGFEPTSIDAFWLPSNSTNTSSYYYGAWTKRGFQRFTGQSSGARFTATNSVIGLSTNGSTAHTAIRVTGTSPTGFSITTTTFTAAQSFFLVARGDGDGIYKCIKT